MKGLSLYNLKNFTKKTINIGINIGFTYVTEEKQVVKVCNN